MADKKVVAWFTMNGKHIPIYEGESKDDAVKRSVTQGSKQGVTAHEHPSKEKKYGIRQFTPNKIGVYYGDEKIGEVDSKEKAELPLPSRLPGESSPRYGRGPGWTRCPDPPPGSTPGPFRLSPAFRTPGPG